MKKSLKGKGGKDIRIIPSEDSITVRFLEGTEDSYGYYEHYDKTNGFFPCTEGEDGIGCDSDDPEERRKSFRYLMNAYVVDDSKVRLVKLPQSLMEQLSKYEEKKGTLLDRDYELSRTGSGQFDTTYMASPDSPKKINLSRFKKLDPAKALFSVLGVGDEDEDDDDDEDYLPRKKSKKVKSAKSRRGSAWGDDDDDDDDVPRSTKKVGRSVKKTVKKSRKIKK